MADNKTTAGVEIQVKASDQAGSVKTIRAELKEATMQAVLLARQFGENSKEATAAAQRVANLRDEIEDAGVRIKSLNPDKFQRIATLTQGAAQGFVAAQGAMALFGGKSEELEKQMVKLQGAIALSQGLQGIKDLSLQFGGLKDLISKQVVAAFTTLRGALVATGIGALVVGVGLLAANFDKVKEAVMKFAPWITDVFNKIKGMVQVFTDYVGITSEAERQIDALTEAHKRMNQEAERDIKIMEASGASAEDIYWKKKEIWQREVQDLEDKKARGETLTEEETKKLYDLWTQYYVDSAARDKRIKDEAKASAEKAKKEADERAKELKKKREEESDAAMMQLFDDFQRQAEWENEKAQEKKEREKAEREAWVDAELEMYAFVNEGQKEAEKKALDEHRANITQRMELTKGGLLALGDLVSSFAAKNEASQKKAFEIQKGINIATTTIDTYMAAQGAYRSQMTLATPDAPIRATIAAAIAIAQGLARVAAISRTQYQQAGTSSGTPSFNNNTPNIGGNLAGSVNNTRQNIEGFSTNSTGGGTGTIKVYVTETDISKAQSRINAIKNRAQIK